MAAWNASPMAAIQTTLPLRPPCCDVVAQKFHRRNSEQTFFSVEYQPCILEPLQDRLQLLLVGPLIRAGYQNVVQVDKYIVQARQGLVHQPLECLLCIRSPNSILRNSHSPKG
jgi:hypothetical protein